MKFIIYRKLLMALTNSFLIVLKLIPWNLYVETVIFDHNKEQVFKEYSQFLQTIISSLLFSAIYKI